jgi:YVTN family beta-propeller protein
MSFLLTLSAAGLWGEQAALLVLHKGASSLGFYTAEGKMLFTSPTGEHPHEIVLSPDGRYAYTTDNGTMRIEQPGAGNNTVSVIDLEKHERAAQIQLGNFRRPHGIDYNFATNRLAVSCEMPDQLLLINPAARRIIRTIDTKGRTSHMVRFRPDGKWAYVSNSTSSNISAIDLESGAVKLIPAGERPEGSVASPDGRFVYVCNRESARITIVDTQKQEAVGNIPTGKGPVRVDITPDGKLLAIALMHDRQMAFADTSARSVIGKVEIGGPPVSIHLSRDGTLAFAATEDDDTVYVVSVRQQKLLRQFVVSKGFAPDPVLPFGRLFPAAFTR